MWTCLSRVGLRLAASVLAASLVAGCASHAPRSQRFVHRGAEKASTDPHAKDAAPPADPPKDSLENYMEKVRTIAAAARPLPLPGPTIEREDPELSAARVMVALQPTAEHHRTLAQAYLRVGVLDAAYDHFAAAVHLMPGDAASYDGLARVWRDWGFPHLGLGDAHRAIYYAPSSAAAYNTLGTLLQQLGQTAGAEIAFQAALLRDPEASYALNNLCYVTMLQGRGTQAIAACRSALRLQPTLADAHNNLGLAYWVHGDRQSAAEEFAVGGAAVARYNTGIALLGSRQFRQAAQAFDEALALSPSLAQARQRARQARALAGPVVDGVQ